LAAALSRPRGWAVIPSGICGMRAAQKLSAG
jgi:hypothetical protein